MWKRKKASFFFTPQRHGANTSVLYEIFGFCYNIVFGLPSEFTLLNLLQTNKNQNLNIKWKKPADSARTE